MKSTTESEDESEVSDDPGSETSASPFSLWKLFSKKRVKSQKRKKADMNTRPYLSSMTSSTATETHASRLDDASSFLNDMTIEDTSDTTGQLDWFLSTDSGSSQSCLESDMFSLDLASSD